jgi:hypothetical protein
MHFISNFDVLYHIKNERIFCQVQEKKKLSEQKYILQFYVVAIFTLDA